MPEVRLRKPRAVLVELAVASNVTVRQPIAPLLVPLLSNRTVRSGRSAPVDCISFTPGEEPGGPRHLEGDAVDGARRGGQGLGDRAGIPAVESSDWLPSAGVHPFRMIPTVPELSVPPGELAFVSSHGLATTGDSKPPLVTISDPEFPPGPVRSMRTVLPAVGVAGAHGPALPAESTPRNCTSVSPCSVMVAVAPAVAEPQVCRRRWRCGTGSSRRR